MSGFLTSQRLDSLGGYKSPPRLSRSEGHSIHIANTLRHSLELLTSLFYASFKSKLPKRDLSLTLEWPTLSSTQALHRQSPCVCYSWGFVPLDKLGHLGITKIVIPRSEKEGMKPPYMCPGCSNHTHDNNMINRCNIINKRVIFLA
jgi:hypothetical protein